MSATPSQPVRQRLLKRLKSKYRLLIIRDTTFEELFSLQLTKLNVIIVFTFLFLVLGAFYVSLILFTPLKEYIPGYADGAVKTSIINASVKADSLQMELEALKVYHRNLKLVLDGKLSADSITLVKQGDKNYQDLNFSTSEQDSLLRLKVDEQEQYNIAAPSAENGKKPTEQEYYFPPIRGVITSRYNAGYYHYGVDVVAQSGESIKAALEGTVIFANWTPDGGYVIQVQHGNNQVTIYKHNSVLLKGIGDRVSVGEPIAIIGNTGELSTGPHLHFELWKNGRPVDPETYIVFN